MSLLSLALVVGSLTMRAQERSRDTVGPSDLARENLSRVAASADQIAEVLRKEPGLMVELKRWVAKEATDHGQIVDDSDLTDQGIFDRLKIDIEFRSVATRLLQRYGFLIPKLSPDSALAKEQEVLIQERTRRLLQAEEETSSLAKRSAEAFEQAEDCSPERERQCAEQPRRPLERRKGRTYTPDLPLEVSQMDVRDRARSRGLSDLPSEQGEIRSPLSPLTDAELGPQPGRASRPVDSLAIVGPGQLITENRPAGAAEPKDGFAPSPLAPERESSDRPRPLASSGENMKEPERSVLVHKANPYADIPSLYDMYTQVSAHSAAPRRFGLDVFRHGTRDSELIPMDLPVGPDYVIGPGDGLAIDLWGGVSQRLYRNVDREGRLTLPEVGPLLVSGRTLGEVQNAVQQVLRTQFRDVSADISLSRLRTIRVYVVGDVEQPGAYDISSLSTPLNALFVARGPTSRGSLRVLRHYRGKQLVQEVDAYDLILRGVKSDIKRLENGDSVLVPPIGPQITIEGAVRRPALYELQGEKTLAEVLELAGGILPTATLRNIQVQRVEAHQKRTMLSLDIPEAQDDRAVSKQLESFLVRDADQIRILPIAPYNQEVVYLQGHVLRPGRYSYRPGMKFADLISSYADLLPEPAGKYAEIVRLNYPDYRPSVESFDLGAALANPAAAPKLQPLDTLRIFGRYDFENLPAIFVWGEVRHPGSYRTSGELHLRDAIQLAGGLTPDALTANAQVFRYLQDSKLKIFSVSLQQAIAGDPLENVLLQPRDRILVHKNLAKADPPSVYIKGEVVKPGRYPLTTNMGVGDLIRLSGGLKRSAYLESADLTRYLVQGKKQGVGEHQDIEIAAALAGNPNYDIPLRDGDVITIRQISHWNDIGAAVSIGGEVQHPGSFGIRPGERLSSVLKRAGGFLSTAYPQAAVLERVEVRQLQEKGRQQLIERIQQDAANIRTSINQSAQEQAALQQAALLQHHHAIESLRQAPTTGRLVIQLRRDLVAFANSPDDIELRNGDTLYVPKRPDFVVVTGQVYISNAITCRPGKNAGWYLKQAGGPTDLANKGAIFIVRANGSVVSEKARAWWSGNVLSTLINPGDTIVVPERPIGGGTFWKNLLSVAQIAQSASIAALVVTR